MVNFVKTFAASNPYARHAVSIIGEKGSNLTLIGISKKGSSTKYIIGH